MIPQGKYSISNGILGKTNCNGTDRAENGVVNENGMEKEEDDVQTLSSTIENTSIIARQRVYGGLLHSLARREYGVPLYSHANHTQSTFILDALIEEKFPKVRVINERVWRTIFSEETLTEHDLSFDDIGLRDDSELHTFLKRFDFSKIEGDKGMTVLTLPKGLMFNSLKHLAVSPREGGRVGKFNCIWYGVSINKGGVSVEKTHRVVISNNILKESEKLSYEQHQDLVKTMDVEMPEFLPAATLSLLTYMSSVADPPTRLYSDDTYTHCIGKIYKAPIAVGGFNSDGLNVSCHPSVVREYNKYKDMLNRAIYGTGIMKRLD